MFNSISHTAKDSSADLMIICDYYLALDESVHTISVSSIEDIGMGRLLGNGGKWFKDLIDRNRNPIHTTNDLIDAKNEKVVSEEEEQGTITGNIVFDELDISGYGPTEDGDEILGY